MQGSSYESIIPRLASPIVVNRPLLELDKSEIKRLHAEKRAFQPFHGRRNSLKSSWAWNHREMSRAPS